MADPPTLLVTTTVLEPTATKILLPYIAEYNVFVTGEVKLLKLLPSSVDIISFPLLPTERNRLLPYAIPYKV